MDAQVFENLYAQNLISETELENFYKANQQPLSVYWELKTLLYLGIVLFTTGLGIIIYTNIDTIGHNVIVAFTGLSCAACFFYCIKKADSFSWQKVQTPDLLFDYILLLGCLLLLIFTGYLQYAYNLFGDRWGMALFFPMLVLFLAAYYFDHLGVLSLAITNLAAWAGISVTPLDVLKKNDFSDDRLIYTGLIFGAGMMAISILSIYKQIKPHFAFTYKNFGLNILFISCLAALFSFESIYLLWFMVLAALAIYFYKEALKEKSFYFLILTVL